MQTSFTQGGHFRPIRSPTLNVRGGGSWGCLQMMTVTPVMSSSSSTATAVSTGSPENTWLGHWARIRLRMVSRRTARSRWRTGWTQKTETSGPWVTPLPRMPTSGGAIISPRLLNWQNTHSSTILSISEYDQREIPLLTKQGGTSIDNLARSLGGGGAGREP